MKRQAQEQIEWIVKGLPKAEEPVYIKYTFYEKTKRRDLDNIAGFAHKVIQDALVAQGILKNDGWANIRGFSDEFQIGEEKIIVEIERNEK